MGAGLTQAKLANTPRAAPWRLNLSRKFTLAFIGLVTFVLLSNGAISLWLSFTQGKAVAVRLQQEKANAAAERINQFVGEIEQQVGWSTGDEWAHVSLEQRRYDFSRLLRQVPAISELAEINSNGHELMRLTRAEPDVVASGADRSGDLRFLKAVTESAYYSPVYFRNGTEPYVSMSFLHGGPYPGVTAAEVSLKFVWDVIDAIHLGDQGYAYITNARGRLVAHPDRDLVLRETDMSGSAQGAKAGFGKQGGAPVWTDIDSSDVLFAHATVPRVNWTVFVRTPLREALAPVFASLKQTAALLGLGLLLALVAGSWLARRMTVPIKRLQIGAERLGSGDLAQRLDIKTGDEIETLADRFNAMAARLQDSYSELEGKVATRTQDLAQSLAQQTAFADGLKIISRSAFDLRSVLNILIELAQNLCRASQGVIYLFDGDILRATAQSGVSPQFMQFIADHPIKPGRATFVGRTALTRDVVHLPDVLEDPEYYYLNAPTLGEFRSALGVPLMHEQDLIGVLAFSRPEPRAFGEGEIELVKTFADQAVIAIQNARLFEKVEARTHDLSLALRQQTATAEVLKIISRSTFDLQAVLDVLVREVTRLCEADAGTIFRLHGEAYHRSAAIGHSAAFETYLAAHELIIPPGSHTLVGRTALENRVVHILDAADDPGYDFGEGRALAGMRSMLGVPLSTQGKTPIGVISLIRTRVEAFTAQQVLLARTFADQAVIAMENARLVQELRDQSDALAHSYNELRATQDRLVQTEKLASLGQLTAGIAHEIKNPLNFVNNFAEVSRELVDELRDALARGGLPSGTPAGQEIDDIAKTLNDNLAKVVQHGRRADSIVKNMLLHSREGSGERREVDINAAVEESLNLAYHGARAEKPGFNIRLEKHLDAQTGKVDVFPQEFTRVMLNLIGNGFYAAFERKKASPDPDFEPCLAVTTVRNSASVEIRVRDNGMGIPEAVRTRMFTPFFTTKPAGEGTGLGLSLSYDIIVKQHGGALDVATAPGEYTEFTITLPSLPRMGPAVTNAPISAGGIR